MYHVSLCLSCKQFDNIFSFVICIVPFEINIFVDLYPKKGSASRNLCVVGESKSCCSGLPGPNQPHIRSHVWNVSQHADRVPASHQDTEGQGPAAQQDCYHGSISQWGYSALCNWKVCTSSCKVLSKCIYVKSTACRRHCFKNSLACIPVQVHEHYSTR